MNIEFIFNEISEFLQQQFPANKREIMSALKYQKNLIVLPSFNRSEGKQFSIDYNWVDYFGNIFESVIENSKPEPSRLKNTIIDITDTYGDAEYVIYEYDWENELSVEAKWVTWFYRCVSFPTSYSRNIFTSVKLIKGPGTWEKAKKHFRFKSPWRLRN